MPLKVLNVIPSLSNEKVVILWQNSLLWPDQSDGNQVRDAVEKDWKDRDFYLNPKANAPSPERGLLSALGYHVGSVRGLEKTLRQAILTRVYKAQLPLVCSEAYMAEWGSPLSTSRETKLINFLRGVIESKRGDVSFTKAIKDWSEDLEFLISIFEGVGDEREIDIR